MPTIKSMVERFKETNKYEHKDIDIEKLLFGREKYSLVMQEEIIKILDKNVIKTTNKEELNRDISEAINASMDEMKIFKDRVSGKKVYKELTSMLNTDYGFKIDIGSLDDIVIGTSEERCVYLLRQTERQNGNGEIKTLRDISDELGCSTRALQKDVKKMTEQGFKLMGLNIKLVSENQNVLQMGSTPHPVILMQNISQLVVMLEGLRAMTKIKAYENSANSTAADVWNQLTEYTRKNILDAIEKLDTNAATMNWYDSIDKEGKYHSRFLTEIENCNADPISQLMYLMKNGKQFNLTYINDEGTKATLCDCEIIKYLIDSHKLTVKTPEGNYEIVDEKIIEIDVI
jgi:DNA-binding Lrp family transcriptional regulator